MKKYMIKIYKYFLLVIIFTIIFYSFETYAQSSMYVRTPGTSEISEGTSISFSDFYTFSNNVMSIRLSVDGEFSSCVDVPTSDEQEIDIDMILPLGSYNEVSVIGYTSSDNCTGSNLIGVLETGTPAFSVVPPTEAEILQKISDNLESFLLIFLFFYLLFGIVKMWKS